MKKILIVDDVIVNRKILKKHFESEYELVEATNGLEALNLLQNENESKPDIILLDIVMPIMNGYEVLNHLQNDEELSTIPVVVMTQKSDENSELRALSAGAIEFINMPYNMAMISQRIKNIISLCEQTEVIKNAERNSVTGLLHGAFLEKAIITALDENQAFDYDMIACKIENYKTIEIGYGETVIHGVQTLITQNLSKLISDNDILGHLDHDTFILLIKRKDNYEDILYPIVMDKHNINGSDIPVKIKFGIYKIPKGSNDALKYITYSNYAASQIFGQYGQYISYYDDKIRLKEENEQFIVNNMQEALDKKQFSVIYVPQFDTVENKLCCLETRVKWIHPEKGEIPFELFNEIFEKTGFIAQMNYYVFERVCENISELEKNNLRLAPISINIARADLYKANVTGKIINILKKYNLPISALKIKVKENQIDVDDIEIMTEISDIKNK